MTNQRRPDDDTEAWLTLLAGRQADHAGETTRAQADALREAILAIERSHPSEETVNHAGLQRLLQRLDQNGLLAPPRQRAGVRPKNAVVILVLVVGFLLLSSQCSTEFPDTSPGFLDLPAPSGGSHEQVLRVRDTATRVNTLKRILSRLELPYRVTRDGGKYYVDIYLPEIRSEPIRVFLERQRLTEPPGGWLRIVLAQR